MPMIGLCKSSLLKPTPRRKDRAAAREGPSVRAMEFFLPALAPLLFASWAMN
jgi:hypothetical protein